MLSPWICQLDCLYSVKFAIMHTRCQSMNKGKSQGFCGNMGFDRRIWKLKVLGMVSMDNKS